MVSVALTASAVRSRVPIESVAQSDAITKLRKRIKEECLNRMIFVGQASLRRAVMEYMEHYYAERNHQGLENRLIQMPAVGTPNVGAIHRRARLGGMLAFYHRKAA